MGRYEDAARIFETILSIRQRDDGMQHPWTAYARQGLATAYMGLGQRDEALPLLRAALKQETASADAPDADAMTLNSAAWSLLSYDFEELRDPVRRSHSPNERSLRLKPMVTQSGCASTRSHLHTIRPATPQQRSRHSAALWSSCPRGQTPGMGERLGEYEAALADGVSQDGDER